MRKSTALKALYRAGLDIKDVRTLYREIARRKSTELTTEQTRKVCELVGPDANTPLGAPSNDRVIEEDYHGKSEDDEFGFDSDYPDDDMEDNRLPSERFYNPHDRIPVR